ncbi:MAG: CPBP family intramembrane metalloprotease [Candidatus Hydrogenedentes bacterium]|nr:CPBP family intramembrane metalloprotease [Candidatus Hydrogenedentota bacterium]
MNDDAATEETPPHGIEEAGENVVVQKQNTLWTLLAAIALIWACSLVIQIGAALILVAIEYIRTGKLADPTESMNFLLVLTYVDWSCALAIAFYFACTRVRKPFREAFALKPISLKVAIQSLAIGIAGSLAAAFLLSWFGTGEAPIYDIAMKEKDGVAGMAIPFILLAVLVPPLEELYYRGFIFPILRSRLSPLWAIAIVALWFGLLHVAQLWGEWVGVVIVVILGTIWTFQRHRYDSLYPSIISHWTYNIFVVATQAFAMRLQ